MMSPLRISRYGRNRSYQEPRPPKMNLFTSRWSPTSSVCSMDCEGILKAWTTKLVPNSARITVTRRDSAYSRSVVRSLTSFRSAGDSTRAIGVASDIPSFTSILFAQELFERLPRCGLFGLFLVRARAGSDRPPCQAYLHDERLAVVRAALADDAIIRRRQTASLKDSWSPDLWSGWPKRCASSPIASSS